MVLVFFSKYKKGSFSIQDVRPPEQVLRELLDLQIAQLGALPVVAKDDDVRPIVGELHPSSLLVKGLAFSRRHWTRSK